MTGAETEERVLVISEWESGFGQWIAVCETVCVCVCV
jgi:hypothetical protein